MLGRALERGAIDAVSQAMLTEVPSLEVVGICTCGCRSIYFARESRKDKRLADTWGHTADGKQMDVMVWGSEGRITCLDLVDYLSTGELPTPESIARPVE